MNQKRLMKTKWFRGIALVLAIILALPAALANIDRLSAAAAEDAEPTRYGDINGDGDVTAADALEALRSAAKLVELKESQILFGNVDGNEALTAADALLILQYAAKMITKFPVEEPKPSEEATPAPARNTAPPQTFDEKNVTPGEKLVPVNLNGAVYDDKNDIYVFSNSKEGIEVPNPIVGNEAFEEDYGYLRKAKAADGKKNPWDLKGSVLGWNADDGKELNVEHADADKLIYNAPKENEVDYSLIPQQTPPEGGHAGFSISFWLQTKKDDENAPLLVINDRNYSTIVTVNGSVNYGTATLQLDSLQNSNYTFIAKKGEWHYYTVTFANDWITFYMDGYEVPFEVTNIGRGKIGYFNDGFLTRYNTALTWTEDDYANHDWQGYLEQQRGEHKDYKSITNDEYTVFGNTRFRGTHRSESTGAKLLLTRMTSKNTKVFIGGANTEVLNRQAKHALTPGTLVSGLTYNLTELNAAQVFANYTRAAEKMPGETSVTEAPSSTEDAEATPLPEVNLTDGRPFNVKDTTNADVTKDSKGLERYTFKAVADPEEAYGVEFENLFDNEEEKEKVRETIDSALDTWQKENNAALFPAGVKAAEADSNHTYYHNYFDTYHGDVTVNPLKLDDEGLNKPDDPNITHTQFHRPVWTKGASIGFWFKPSQAVIDSSNTDAPIPIMTMYATNKFAFEMEADGSLAFVDLNNAAWDGNRRLQANQWCHNSFMTEGDPSKVKADAWNYYTITFANDWIQVYINGEELVYKVSGLRKQGMKEFNGGFMSKYNPVGLVLPEDPDPNGYIKNNGNGTDKYGNYGGITLKMQTYDEYKSTNEKTDNDDASIRATGVYEVGYHAQKEVEDDNYQYTLLLDALTTSDAKFYMGGCQTSMNKALGWGIEGSATKRIRYTDHLVPQGIQFADVRFFEDDLTAAQAQEAYEKAKARMGEETGEEPGPQPGGDTEDADYVANRHKSATYSNGIYTFTAPVKEDELTYMAPDRYDELQKNTVDQAFGVELKNPFVTHAGEIRQTIIEALAGQELVYPQSPKAEYAAAASSEALTGDGLLLANGNAGDTYNGVKYQYPKWSKGATISFWYKPADLSDRSPILYMCGDSDKGGAFGLLSDGSVLFASLKYGDWTQRQAIGATHCFNCFTAMGDGEETKYVKEGEWNYYTVTFANDWIQVYVNGEELIYKYVNLKGDTTGQGKYNLKFFNAGFMTRYNTIGQPTEDPKGYFKACGGLAENGVDNFLCSIRANNQSYKFSHTFNEEKGLLTAESGYEAEIPVSPTYYAVWDNELGKENTITVQDVDKLSVSGSLMMDLLTDSSMKLYMGGAPSQLSSDGNPSVIREGTGKGGTGWNAFAYDSEKEITSKRANYPKEIPTPSFWFDSKHNQEGSSFADFTFVEPRELTAAEVKAAYDKLTKDPEGNALAAE